MGIQAMGGPIRGISQYFDLQCGRGYKIPSMGFGTYRMDADAARQAVTYAIQCGFRHVDCAKIYGNEAAVGEALKHVAATNIAKREQLFVTSKLWPTDQHPDHVEKACRATLRDLQLEYLDLYLIHWPVAWKHTGKFDTDEDRMPRGANGLALVDHTVTLQDTWRAMCRLVDLGLVRSIGLSNCNVAHVEEIMQIVEHQRHAPVVNQIEFHPGCFQSDLWSSNGEHGLHTAAYCPLGMPTRFTPAGFTGIVNDDMMKPLSQNSGFSPARVLLNWNLDNGNIVIVKSTKKEHIEDNAKACRYALSDSVRWVLNHFEDQLEKSMRVIDPVDFTDKEGPFFPPRGIRRRVHRP